jgi:hypothetical protein
VTDVAVPEPGGTYDKLPLIVAVAIYNLLAEQAMKNLEYGDFAIVYRCISAWTKCDNINGSKRKIDSFR